MSGGISLLVVLISLTRYLIPQRVGSQRGHGLKSSLFLHCQSYRVLPMSLESIRRVLRLYLTAQTLTSNYGMSTCKCFLNVFSSILIMSVAVLVLNFTPFCLFLFLSVSLSPLSLLISLFSLSLSLSLSILSSHFSREPLPGHWDTDLNSFQKLLVLRSIRADKVTNAVQDYVAEMIGQRFIEPQTADLKLAYKDSSPSSPLIFILSQGTDPAADLYKFAEEMKFQRKLSAISLGQGQGPRAEAMMRSAMDRGQWVFFQNCHLSPSWMPALERLIEQIDPQAVSF